jgi:ribosomal protein S18 acetylase RimI-like enzyme
VNTRPATNEDSDFVYQVKVHALKDYITKTWGWDEDLQWKFHQESFRPACTQIIRDAEEDAGFLVVEETDDEFRLHEINLLGKFQGQGIGTQIIREIQETAVSQGKRVELQVLKVNPGIRLYERLGFYVYNETETHRQMTYGVLIHHPIHDTPPVAPNPVYQDAIRS